MDEKADKKEEPAIGDYERVGHQLKPIPETIAAQKKDWRQKKSEINNTRLSRTSS